MTLRASFLTYAAVAAMVFAIAGPSQAARVLDDPLQGGTTAPATGGAQQGGTFGSGGWHVDNAYDCIYWHVAPSAGHDFQSGAFEYDVVGLGPAPDCPCIAGGNTPTGQSGKNELSHMYDYTWIAPSSGESGGDTGFWSYRNNPYKQFIRKQCESGKENTLELVFQTTNDGCGIELDSAVLPWSKSTSYHFRTEWSPVGSNTEIRTYRTDNSTGIPVLTRGPDTICGHYQPVGLSVRIGASTRHDSWHEDAALGAVYSNVRVYDSGGNDQAAPPTILQPAAGETVTGPLALVQWAGDSHNQYQVRVNGANNPDTAVLWDSQTANSNLSYAWTGTLSNGTCYAFVRVGNSGSFGPWSLGRNFTVNTSYVPPGPDLVQVEGTSLSDKNGPFVALGATYMRALRFCKYDRNRFDHDCALLASKGFNYYRSLSMVSWAGLEIMPVNGRNNQGQSVPAWTDYDQQLRDMIDVAYGHGLRTQITIFADAQNVMPDDSVRMAHLDRILSIIKTPDANNSQGREHKIILLEVANEYWQNGFPDPGGVADVRNKGAYLAARTSVPVALSSGDISAMYVGSAADIATIHFSRDLGTIEGGWLPVHDCWSAAHVPGVPPVSSNEPIGSGSSVASEDDPIKLSSAAYFAYLANLPMYVYHSRAGTGGDNGVDHDVTFEETAGINAYQFVRTLLPPDASSWVRNDGIEASAPFTVYCNGQANKYWPDLGISNGIGSGCDRNIGATKGGEFMCYPMGILSNGLTIQARRAVSFTAYNPLTGEAVYARTMNTNDQFTLAQGPGAYLIKSAGAIGLTEPSIDLGNPDVQTCMVLAPNADGDTVVATVGGRTCRRSDKADEDYYFYFAVCDSFAYQGSRPDLWISFDYYDYDTGTITLQYDSIAGIGQPGGDATHYVTAGSVTLTNGPPAWRHAKFHLTDAGFNNGQNGGADFRFGKLWGSKWTSQVPPYIDKVWVTVAEPLPPIIAEVAPDPKIIIVGTAYTEQLTLTQGTLPVTWSVVEGPAGLLVSSSGLVSGWTPGIADLGDHNITIEAENLEGSDLETWVVRVISLKDFDLDGDVDLEDFGFFQRCLSGTGLGYDLGCAAADLDGNGAVDQGDFGLFWPCFSGPGQPPGC